METQNPLDIKMTKCTIDYSAQLWEVSIWLQKMRAMMKIVAPTILDKAVMFRCGLYLREAGFCMDSDWYENLLIFLKAEPERARIHMEEARATLQANTVNVLKLPINPLTLRSD